MPDSILQEARKAFHVALLERILRSDEHGVPSNADKHSKASVAIAQAVLQRMGDSATGARLAGQISGSKFEEVCHEYLEAVFPRLQHLRPGEFAIMRGTARTIAECDQYEHLAALQRAVDDNADLAVSLGTDYIIKPDVVIVRQPEPDASINSQAELVSEQEARRTSLRRTNQPKPILHASVSCKWTLRSDRAQNARSEALNLVRNRKGKLPHVVVVTGEPLPSRLASVALGTGDIDCVYHAALPELLDSVSALGFADAEEMLRILSEGKRLRDISDLPLDLVI